MKLYVVNKNNHKVYINVVATNRKHLAYIIGGAYFVVDGQRYHVSEVQAEKETSDTTAGIILGGLFGLIGGPVGVLVGGTLGGLIGNSSDNQYLSKAQTFNNSPL